MKYDVTHSPCHLYCHYRIQSSETTPKPPIHPKHTHNHARTHSTSGWKWGGTQQVFFVESTHGTKILSLYTVYAEPIIPAWLRRPPCPLVSRFFARQARAKQRGTQNHSRTSPSTQPFIYIYGLLCPCKSSPIFKRGHLKHAGEVLVLRVCVCVQKPHILWVCRPTATCVWYGTIKGRGGICHHVLFPYTSHIDCDRMLSMCVYEQFTPHGRRDVEIVASKMCFLCGVLRVCVCLCGHETTSASHPRRQTQILDKTLGIRVWEAVMNILASTIHIQYDRKRLASPESDFVGYKLTGV